MNPTAVALATAVAALHTAAEATVDIAEKSALHKQVDELMHTADQLNILSETAAALQPFI